jgi:hypothetical protein
MTTELQKLLEKRASSARVSFERIDPKSNYTAILDFFLRTVVDAAIADGVKLETLVAILIGGIFHTMEEVSPSGMASMADSDTVLKIVQAQHARIAKVHDPVYIEELKKDAAARRASLENEKIKCRAFSIDPYHPDHGRGQVSYCIY